MRKLFPILFVLLLLSCHAAAAQERNERDVTLAWDASMSPDVKGYRVYAREAQGAYDYSSPSCDTQGTRCAFRTEMRCFVARAYSAGSVSADSNEVCVMDAPRNMRITVVVEVRM